jgi:hypothetical protein
VSKKIIRLAKVILYAVAIILCIFGILVVWPLNYFQYPTKAYAVLVIENVSIIDVEQDAVYPNQVVVIRNGIIEKIGDTAFMDSAIDHEKVKRINGRGQFLMPALWDMHVHVTKRSPHVAYPAFISHGVTHVRDMRGAYDDNDPFAGVQGLLEKWNAEVERHQLIGPRLHGFTSFAIEGPHQMFKGKPSFFNCASPADAVQLVHYLKERHVTLIKIYNHIPRDAFFTLMREAAKAGIDVAGHKPYRVSTVEASNAGMKSLEHAKFFIWDSYTGADSLRANHLFTENTLLRKDILQRQDSILLQKMFDVFKKNHTWYCPTHLTRKQDAFAGDASFRSKYKGINPILRFIAFEDLDATIQEDTTVLANEVYKAIYLKGLQISRAAYHSEVKILAGSDVPELPGSSLHEELMELSNAGLPNFEVLRAATLYPAQYYGLESQYGSIREGKKADLLLLAKNPVDAIVNTITISSLVLDGRHLDADFLQQLKQKVSKRENSMSMSAKLLWDMLIYISL